MLVVARHMLRAYSDYEPIVTDIPKALRLYLDCGILKLESRRLSRNINDSWATRHVTSAVASLTNYLVIRNRYFHNVAFPQEFKQGESQLAAIPSRHLRFLGKLKWLRWRSSGAIPSWDENNHKSGDLVLIDASLCVKGESTFVVDYPPLFELPGDPFLELEVSPTVKEEMKSWLAGRDWHPLCRIIGKYERRDTREIVEVLQLQTRRPMRLRLDRNALLQEAVVAAITLKALSRLHKKIADSIRSTVRAAGDITTTMESTATTRACSKAKMRSAQKKLIRDYRAGEKTLSLSSSLDSDLKCVRDFEEATVQRSICVLD